MTARRFPPPWTVEELDDCFVVRDHSGHALIAIPHILRIASALSWPDVYG
jgi:hypothetical protein